MEDHSWGGGTPLSLAGSKNMKYEHGLGIEIAVL
jgi:hypothetical protein